MSKASKSKASKKNKTETTRVERPNKTQGKRDIELLKSKASQLVNLSASKLESLMLQPALMDAIEEMQRIKSHNAKSRHLQYLVRLLSDQSNLEEIDQKLYLFANPHLAHQKLDKEVEALSEKILQGEQSSIDLFINHPDLSDRQQFLQLVRNAQKEFYDLQQANIEKKEDLNQTVANQAESDTVKLSQGKQIKKLKQFIKSLLK